MSMYDNMAMKITRKETNIQHEQHLQYHNPDSRRHVTSNGIGGALFDQD